MRSVLSSFSTGWFRWKMSSKNPSIMKIGPNEKLLKFRSSRELIRQLDVGHLKATRKCLEMMPNSGQQFYEEIVRHNLHKIELYFQLYGVHLRARKRSRFQKNRFHHYLPGSRPEMHMYWDGAEAIILKDFLTQAGATEEGSRLEKKTAINKYKKLEIRVNHSMKRYLSELQTENISLLSCHEFCETYCFDRKIIANNI